MEVTFEFVDHSNIDLYVNVGQQSYREHYLHLWENEDPLSYLSISFYHEPVMKELLDTHCENYLIKTINGIAGVLKISFDKGYGKWSAKDSLYLHRIYLLNAYSGIGVGKATLEFVCEKARAHNKKVIWLEAMKKGVAKNFYQKNGFKIVGETIITLKGILHQESEMWVMAKTL